MLFEDTYLTIATPVEGLFKDRGSKFLAFAYPVKTEQVIKEHLQQLKKEHVGANHHCYAFRLGADKLAFRANDDGEPSNTAGRPILGQIQSNDLTNILIVVVRYFGGTLLGVSGLINAYKSAAADAIANATMVTEIVQEVYEIAFEYPAMNEVMKVVKDSGVLVLEQDFQLNCRLLLAVRRNDAMQLTNTFKTISTVHATFLRML